MAIKEEELKRVLNYFKGKDIKKADKLLFDTAINNFRAGERDTLKKVEEEIDSKLIEINKEIKISGEVLCMSRKAYFQFLRNDFEELKQKLNADFSANTNRSGE